MEDPLFDFYVHSLNRWSLRANAWRDHADRWRRYAVGTAVAFLATWLMLIAVTIILPAKVPVLVGRTMTIHCPSEDGGRAGCVWDTWTDGNGRGDLDGPRWLVWP